MIRIYTVCYFVCIFWMSFCMVKSYCTIFSIITAIFFRGVESFFFGFFWYQSSPVYRVFLLGHQTMTYHTYRVYHRYIDIPAYQADSPVCVPSPVYTVFLLGHQTTYRVYHRYINTPLTRLRVRCMYLLLCIQYFCWAIRQPTEYITDISTPRWQGWESGVRTFSCVYSISVGTSDCDIWHLQSISQIYRQPH